MSENANTHRKPGGQPGNHNALKHGRYIAKENLPTHHYSAEEQIAVIDHLIRSIKNQMERTYQEGIKIHTLRESLKTMNSLSLAAIGLCRLVNLYDRMTRVSISPIFKGEHLEQDAVLAELLASFTNGHRSALGS